MGVLKLVVAAGAIAGAVYVAKPGLFASPQRKCKPIPVSAMDPHPGLAPFRCAPDTPGDGPTIDVGNPRVRYGAGESPPEGEKLVARRDDENVRSLLLARERAYLDLIDAQADGDPNRVRESHARYREASARLANARGAANRR